MDGGVSAEAQDTCEKKHLVTLVIEHRDGNVMENIFMELPEDIIIIGRRTQVF